jgi:tRNA 5-methylaminomethyl-2-thiouridine biosynthesis bifunctional protein
MTIEHAQLDWNADGQPTSHQFGDIYFSRESGLEETRYVFLQQNHLRERWQQLKDNHHFVIGETGFGSGLNFIAACELWLATAPETAQLHFVSVEKFPLSKTDLIRVLALWPALNAISLELITHYPCFVGNGFHRLNFFNGRIKLTLIINDAAIGLTQLLASQNPEFAGYCAKIDAWFFDGFSPSKNPEMWSYALFSAIEKLSREGTTAATFSAAVPVKKGLIGCGFSIEKIAGFGRKRDMIKAVLLEKKITVSADIQSHRSYSAYPIPWTIDAESIQSKREKCVAIIGGGIAGCTSARALAERGWHVTIIEKHNALAQEGSGNPQGALYAKLSPENEPQAEFNLCCLQFAFHFYRHLWNDIGGKTGVLQLAYNQKEIILQKNLLEKFLSIPDLVKFVSAEEASQLAGIFLSHSGIFFPEAGWINPKKLCHYLVGHKNIEIITGIEVKKLEKINDGWILNNNHSLSFPYVIIANAGSAAEFPVTKHLPIKTIRGQVSYLPVTEKSRAIKTVICSEGYLAPAENQQHCVGATFNLGETSLELREEDHQKNINTLYEQIPSLASVWQSQQQLSGHVAFRCTLPDYLPMIGPVADAELMQKHFSALRKNARANIEKTGNYLAGLYINIGHGSRGLTYAPLCAELLAAQMNHDPLPMPRELSNVLNPARFLIRDLIKNKI